MQTDQLPAGVDALASADGRMIMVRASLDRAARGRALREVLATLRRFPRLALVPALTSEGARQVIRSLSGALSGLSQEAAQLASAAGDHIGGAAVAVTASAGAAVAVTAVLATGTPGGAPWPERPVPVSVPAPAGGGHPPPGVPRPRGHSGKRLTPLRYLGVYAPGVPGSVAGLNQFAVTTGRQPNVALYYSSWYERFRLEFARQAYSDGATPAVQIEPFGISLAAVAAGRYDDYLRAYARQVAAYGHPVIIGFAHEPDGGWYPWGAGHCPPRTWIAAWRHVVGEFREAGAGNVIWLWTMNAQGPAAAAMRRWWPGAAYVTWIGIDGYYVRPADTFASVFGAALAATRGLGRPVLIAETAVGPGTGDRPRAIASLFAGARARRLLGLIWFDQDQDGGRYHQDWRLEGDPSAVRAFRRGLAGRPAGRRPAAAEASRAAARAGLIRY
ncbi:MAG TPA: glycosyl hydrolase [Streptosporangiaceae bacterium]|nr:glycosyl hydrolase [Streptosporangiaceae bacterium]